MEINMETVIIKKEDSIIRVFGTIEKTRIKYNNFGPIHHGYKYTIHLTYPISDDIDINTVYNIELLHEKVIFRGYISEDRKTIREY